MRRREPGARTGVRFAVLLVVSVLIATASVIGTTDDDGVAPEAPPGG